MVLYSKSFYQAWNCCISFKSQAKWVREEANQREQFISSWERAVKCCHVWAETKLVRLSCQGNVVGEELYCPGKSPKTNVPLKSMLNLLFWVLRLYTTKKKQLQLWRFTNKSHKDLPPVTCSGLLIASLKMSRGIRVRYQLFLMSM